MPAIFTKHYETPLFKGNISVNTGLFIDGEFVESISGETIEVLHPCNGETITHVALGSSQDIDAAVQAARVAYKTSWGQKVPAAERGRLLHRLADLMEKNIEELCAIDALDGGKNFGIMKMGDYPSAISAIRYFAGWADKNSGKTIEVDETKFAYTRHEPIGVVGAIIPWNFPLVFVCWKMAPALATGNCLILKPSELTPLSALKMAELAREAGFPPGVFNVVTGYGSTVGQALVEHPHIGKISFTGSTLTGRKIMETAARSNLKRVSLELGGKSPVIVFDDADLEQAVGLCVGGAYIHSGQLCGAGTRIFVQETIYDKFLPMLTAAVQSLKRCDFPFASFMEGTHSPLVSRAQFDRVMRYIQSGKEAGATIHVGGERYEGPDSNTGGFYVQPTIFTDATADMKIMREEIFGPVVVVGRFKNEEEAVALANDTSYGLSSVVLTENINRAFKISNALEAGNVFVNCSFFPVAQVPFGGTKLSGYGKDLGQEALDEFTVIKAVHINIGKQL